MAVCGAPPSTSSGESIVECRGQDQLGIRSAGDACELRIVLLECSREPIEDRGVELCSSAAEQLDHGLLVSSRQPVRAIGGHRHVGICDREDQGLDRDLLGR